MGTANAPIIVRQYPGERATIVNAASATNGLTINGAYTWYWGFEVTNTNPNSQNVAGIMVFAPGSKLINLIIHDFSGVGLGIWEQAPDAEVYGSIIYYNGFTGSDPGVSFGHGIYAQNATGAKLLRDNIVFDNYGYGYHLFGQTAMVRNFTLEGNAAFYNLRGNLVLRGYAAPVTTSS